jgi:hypothetical protein
MNPNIPNMYPTTNQQNQVPQNQVPQNQVPQNQGYLGQQNQGAEDPILSKTMFVRTMTILRPISPIQYNIEARSIERMVLHLHGITKSIEVIGVKTIDKVNIEQGIFFGRVRIIHMDKSEIRIEQISKSNAIKVKTFFEQVVEFQRRNVVNVTGD